SVKVFKISERHNSASPSDPHPAMDPLIDEKINRLQSLPAPTWKRSTQLNKLLSIKLNYAVSETVNLRNEVMRLNKNKSNNQQTIQCLLNNELSKDTSEAEMSTTASQTGETNTASQSNKKPTLISEPSSTEVRSSPPTENNSDSERDEESNPQPQ
ncbi:hypothetical protein CBL_21315, partial [Carabus blaptoides fortunei]